VVFCGAEILNCFYVAESYVKRTLVTLSLKLKIGWWSAALVRESLEDEHFVTMQ
jgi:hypothetical protein